MTESSRVIEICLHLTVNTGAYNQEGGMRQRTVFARYWRIGRHGVRGKGEKCYAKIVKGAVTSRSQRYARKRENGKTAGEERRAGGAVVVKASGRRRVRRIGKRGGWERGVK